MRINIHAGHNPDGKLACGAVGYIKESTENRKVKDEVIRLLREKGHTVFDCTVDNGLSQNDVLNKIVAKCNANLVDIDMSIHFNAGANKNKDNKSTGVECFVYSNKSKVLDTATNICKSISSLGFKNRGVKYSTSLKYLRSVKNPCVLVECCFVDDPDDVALYDYKSMARAIVGGICAEELPKSNVDKFIEELTALLKKYK